MATVKITELPSATSITSDDLLVMVDSGNPYVTKKISWKNIDSPQDGVTYARKDGNWVNITSPANLQVRRGTASEVSGIIPLQGEPVWDTTNKILYVGDESTYGGIPVAYPTKTYKFVNLSGGDFYPWFSISLSPQNSVWELSMYADFDLAEEANSSANFSLSSSTNLTDFLGNSMYLDSTGTAQQFRIDNASQSFTSIVTGDNELLRMNCVFRVSASNGTLIFTEQNDNHERGANVAYVILKRII